MGRSVTPQWLMKLRKIILGMLLAAVALVFFLGLLEAHHVTKSLPEGIPFRGLAYPAEDVRFLSDTTCTDASGKRVVRQEIFDEILALIGGAEKLVLLDMFLMNDFQGASAERFRALSDELAAALVKRKKEVPGLRAVLITDPINTVYGGVVSARFDALRDAGVEVVVTDLKRLRDSNPAYSALWRPTFGLFGNSHQKGWLRNPFGGEAEVSLRSWLGMFNFKANHRKVIIADSAASPGGWAAMVTSANPHDASSAHGNVALRFTGQSVGQLFESESAVLKFSGGNPVTVPMDIPMVEDRTGLPTVAVLTESAIKAELISSIDRAGRGDRLRIAVFYLSDRDIVWALKEAAEAGAEIRVLLDPNIDAFGHEKNGIPNRQSGAELAASGISLRWCDTHGEQCHAKMLLADYISGASRLIAGSANFTRRNLDDLNLESDVIVEGPSDLPVFNRARGYFSSQWANGGGLACSADYDKYAEDSILRDYLYRFMEASGISTF